MIRIIRNLIILAIVFGIGYLCGNKEVRFYTITSSGMEPTFELGDKVIAIKSDLIKRKDIVLIKHPNNNKEIIIRRIIGLPGEKIKMKKGDVYINNEKLDENYIEKDNSSYTKTIPYFSYFVLSDNRKMQDDSSVFGPIENSLILKKVIVRYWPIKKFKIFINYQ